MPLCIRLLMPTDLKGQWIMEQLGLGLIPGQYGMTATQKERDRSQLSINADAFMHPIVNAYRSEGPMDHGTTRPRLNPRPIRHDRNAKRTRSESVVDQR